MMFDIAIIGAGVVGCMIARELSKYKLRVVLLEKSNDVAMGASKANSGIVHAGFDAKVNSLKAKMNIRGCELMESVCKDLNVPYIRNGSLVVAFSDEEMQTLQELLDRGLQNGVTELSILNKEELKALEPNISDEAVGALRAATAGIVCPYSLSIAAAENAVTNGVVFKRNFEVINIEYNNDAFSVSSADDSVLCKYVINAAGCFSDKIASLIGDEDFHIVPRRGEYYVLDKSVGNLVSHTIFQCPTKMGKGILVSPTVHGNLLIGPTADDIEDYDDLATTAEGLLDVRTFATKSVPAAIARHAITSFAGNRAHDLKNDFTIAPSVKNPHFIHVEGVESPGLTSAPAIAEYVAEILSSLTTMERRDDYIAKRPKVFRFHSASDEERADAIARNPLYGRIICRCETITEGEIVDAIHSPAGAVDVDGVKRRTRAGMGRCQGGFCGSKVVEILARELHVEPNEITKYGRGSVILYDKTK